MVDVGAVAISYWLITGVGRSCCLLGTSSHEINELEKRRFGDIVDVAIRKPGIATSIFCLPMRPSIVPLLRLQQCLSRSMHLGSLCTSHCPRSKDIAIILSIFWGQLKVLTPPVTLANGQSTSVLLVHSVKATVYKTFRYSPMSPPQKPLKF